MRVPGSSGCRNDSRPRSLRGGTARPVRDHPARAAATRRAEARSLVGDGHACARLDRRVGALLHLGTLAAHTTSGSKRRALLPGAVLTAVGLGRAGDLLLARVQLRRDRLGREPFALTRRATGVPAAVLIVQRSAAPLVLSGSDDAALAAGVESESAHRASDRGRDGRSPARLHRFGVGLTCRAAPVGVCRVHGGASEGRVRTAGRWRSR
jgi:hypothetical protein